MSCQLRLQAALFIQQVRHQNTYQIGTAGTRQHLDLDTHTHTHTHTVAMIPSSQHNSHKNRSDSCSLKNKNPQQFQDSLHTRKYERDYKRGENRFCKCTTKHKAAISYSCFSFRLRGELESIPGLITQRRTTIYT